MFFLITECRTEGRHFLGVTEGQLCYWGGIGRGRFSYVSLI